MWGLVLMVMVVRGKAMPHAGGGGAGGDSGGAGGGKGASGGGGVRDDATK